MTNGNSAKCCKNEIFQTIWIISSNDKKQYAQCLFAIEYTLTSIEDYR